MLKIPPPLLVLILVISNYFSSKKIDLILLPNQNLISFIILLVGVLILINPILKFIKSKTTIDPIKFKKVNKLITSLVFRFVDYCHININILFEYFLNYNTYHFCLLDK